MKDSNPVRLLECWNPATGLLLELDWSTEVYSARRACMSACPGGASAHELDKLSASSPANIQLLAKGENPGGSGADVVYYESESGGAVFSAGSLCWTLSIAVDEGVSSITANVLRRFTS